MYLHLKAWCHQSIQLRAHTVFTTLGRTRAGYLDWIGISKRLVEFSDFGNAILNSIYTQTLRASVFRLFPNRYVTRLPPSSQCSNINFA